jgi:hypothetical protein
MSCDAAVKAGKFLKRLHNRIASRVEGEPASSASSFAERPHMGEVLVRVPEIDEEPCVAVQRTRAEKCKRCTSYVMFVWCTQAGVQGSNSSAHGSQFADEASDQPQGHGDIRVRTPGICVFCWIGSCRAPQCTLPDPGLPNDIAQVMVLCISGADCGARRLCVGVPQARLAGALHRQRMPAVVQGRAPTVQRL